MVVVSATILWKYMTVASMTQLVLPSTFAYLVTKRSHFQIFVMDFEIKISLKNMDLIRVIKI